MNYSLANHDNSDKKRRRSVSLLKKFSVFLSGEGVRLSVSILCIIINSIANISTPILLGFTIDNFIKNRDLSGLTKFSALILAIYLIISLTAFIQTRTMGTIGQNVLYKLRNAIFSKIQSLPVVFFNQNKLGDLISRINNDTDKLNQFFSQSLVQFVGNIFTIAGVGVFIFFINIKLASITVVSAAALLVITFLVSPWIGKKNRQNLSALGSLSAEIQESLNNFKVIVSFDRRDYFRNNFESANNQNFSAAVKAGIAGNITAPLYDLSGNIATLCILFFGIQMINQKEITLGILVAFLSYSDKFYSPLRQMAAIWSNALASLAAWDRILEILNLHTNLSIKPFQSSKPTNHIMKFENVSFAYSDKKILHEVSFTFDQGKTYAIVGPTGGGKSTTASLMTRLFDPQEGAVYFEGHDIRTIDPKYLAQKIGFILQDQFLFTGTVGENIAYGNNNYQKYSKTMLENEIAQMGLSDLLDKFEEGLDTLITPNTEMISLGQKQIISFIRAIIRKPSLLIMDEATANIDTITEGQLQKILDQLPPDTTKIIIAHRFNTIKKADEIYFVNGGQVISAESYQASLELIKHSKLST